MSKYSRNPNPTRYVIIAGCWNTWDRFVSLTDFSGPDGCWNYTGIKTPEGYGVFTGGEHGTVFAHRLALHLAKRPVPADMTVDHLCRNTSCVNPAHLDIVSMTENNLRGNGYMAQNARKTECVHGHPFDEENTGYVPSRTKVGKARYCKQCRKNAYLRRKNAA